MKACGTDAVVWGAGSESDFEEPECSVERAEGAFVIGLEEVVGLLWGLDEGTSVTGVRRTVGEQLGEETFRLPLMLPLITFTLLLLLLLLRLPLLYPFSWIEILGGDSLRSELFSESFRHIS